MVTFGEGCALRAKGSTFDSNLSNIFNRVMHPNQESLVAAQSQTTANPQYDYVGPEVQIGSGRLGIKPLAQHGTIIINDNELWLLGSHNQLIAQAPLGLCTATKGPWFTFGQIAWLTV